MATTMNPDGKLIVALPSSRAVRSAPPPMVRLKPSRPFEPAPAAPAMPRAGQAFESLMTRRDKAIYLAFVGLWLAANYSFWSWWLTGSHGVGLAGFVLNTLLISVDLIEPAWFYFFVFRMRRPVAVGPPHRFRVAAVTTKTPAEPLEVVAETLLAIRAMHGQHDTWLLDEAGDPTVRAWCAHHGIEYFSRAGVTKYQQARWPFQSRMKAGNYNSWLDAIGFERYEVLCQFDSDHKPARDYIEKALVPLQCDEVAYVAAPSICHGNKADSWTVLGRAEMEATFHGPLQAGFNDGYAPLIIGSHCTFRLSALKELGGFQTTWCEDHDNTLAFNSMGHAGVFQIDAIAVGDGPTSFAQAMQQEYQWSRGLMQILLSSTPLWLANLSRGKKFQFLFSQTWYPRLGLIKLGCVLLPGIALVSDARMANVEYVEFLARELLVGLPCLAAVTFLAWRGWTRPNDAAFVSWRTPLFQMARWPWVLLACGEAVLGKLLGRDFAIKVTSKGKSGPRPLPLLVLWPYVAIVAFSVTVAELLKHHSPNAEGYGLIALVTAGWYTLLLSAVVLLHVKENAAEHSWRIAIDHTRRGLGVAVAACFATLIGLGSQLHVPYLAEPPALEAVAYAVADGPEATLGVSASRPVVRAMPLPEPIAVDEWVARGAVRPPSPAASVSSVAFPADRVTLGAYDPNRALAEFDLGAEVLFHQWRANGAPRLARELDQVLSDGRTPVLSLLPRPYGIAFVTRNTLLEDIGDGDYDSTIRSYARAIGMRGPSAVVVRFAPEMELEGAHVWSQGKPDAYIRAYRHLVEVFRAERATNVVWMWSPAGNDGADKFYPGDDVVDVIGVTILASEAWDKSWGFAGARSFERLLDEKYRWAEMFDRPLVVAEAGVSTSSPADAAAWLAGVPETLARYPRLRGFCYFNANQPVDTPEIDVFPDWRLASPDLLFTRKPVR